MAFKTKKALKIIGGIIIFFTLPSLLFFAFLYFKYNEELPTGTQGDAADILATRMLNALNHDAYKATDYIEFTFKKRHHFKWYKAKNTCEVYWKNIKVDLDLNQPNRSEVFVSETLYKGDNLSDYIHKAEDLFNNDSFWLVAPYKVFDNGVERRLVKTKEGKDALLVTYTSGGSTPGDSYLWHFDDSGKPTSFQMWVDILPINGLEASWSDWTTTTTDAQLPTFHKLLFLGLEIEDVRTKSFTNDVFCEQSNHPNPNNDNASDEKLDDIVIKVCSFRNYQSLSTANPSYNGKYYYDYKLFKKLNDSIIEIENSDMFNSEIEVIVNIINEETKANYEYLKKDSSLNECVEQIHLKNYTLDDMGITFSESEEITFYIDYGLTNACDNINGSVHTMKIEDIQSFFK